MSRDDAWPRGSVTGNRAWCSACHRMFGGPASFDKHRGIRAKPRDEEAQDAGTCTLKGLSFVDRVYWTPEELYTRERLARLRATGARA